MADARNTVIVTGGNTGIGEAICRTLLDSGQTVVSLARRKSDMHHDRFHSYSVDLADRDETEAIAATVADRHPAARLVHNAGVIRPALLDAVNRDDLDYLTDLHLGAAVTLSQALLPVMKEAGFGRIVNISSRAALGLETRTAYSATKAGMIGMTRTWALELGPYGITVNAVAPGPIAETEMFHDVIPADSEKMDQLAAAIPVRRLGRPDDVANAVNFLLGEEAGFVTGQTLYVCGGTSVGTLGL